jgi:hypothetical protein
VKAYYEGMSGSRSIFVARHQHRGLSRQGSRDGLALEGYPNPRDVATDVLATIEAVTPRSKVTTWIGLTQWRRAWHWTDCRTRSSGSRRHQGPRCGRVRAREHTRQLTQGLGADIGERSGRPSFLSCAASRCAAREAASSSARPRSGSPVPQEAKAVSVTIAKEATLEAVLEDTRFLSLSGIRPA